MSGLFGASLYIRRGTMHALGACGISAALFSAVIFLAQSLVGVLHWFTVWSVLLIGAAISLMSWAAEQLWYSSMKEIMPDPFSAPGFLIRVPFWYIAAGIGYTIGMVTAKQFGLIGFYDVPIAPVFHFGARIGTMLMLALHVYSLRSSTKFPKRGET